MFTRVRNGCLPGSLHDVMTKTVNLKLKLVYLSFQKKIKIFQRDILSRIFCHFPNAEW